METNFEKPLDQDVTENSQAIVSNTQAITNINNKYMNRLSATTDFNSITNDGVYLFTWVANGTTYHRPDNSGGLLIASTSTAGSAPTKQQLFQSYTGQVFSRGYTNGSWTSWQELATTARTPKLEYRTLRYKLNTTLNANETQNITMPLSPALPFSPIGALIINKGRNIMYAVSYFDMTTTSITVRFSTGQTTTDTTTEHDLSILFFG